MQLLLDPNFEVLLERSKNEKSVVTLLFIQNFSRTYLIKNFEQLSENFRETTEKFWPASALQIPLLQSLYISLF